ncbi:MAG: RrF2 family transcriptional regulator [Clostridiales bacterium]|nr:RrF2 family transcriptional regulator [Clostridiales bacterium]
MKVSTKGRYGLRAIIDLILNSNGQNVPLVTIAERQDISKNYLEQVFSSLRNAGIVSSTKGAQGGYYLADKPSNITVGDVLRVLEGDLSVVSSDLDIQENPIEDCIHRYVWDKVDSKVYEIIDGITLEDLVNEYKDASNNFMYYI